MFELTILTGLGGKVVLSIYLSISCHEAPGTQFLC